MIVADIRGNVTHFENYKQHLFTIVIQPLVGPLLDPPMAESFVLLAIPLRQATRIAKRLPKYVLNLAVRTPHVVYGPFLYGLPYFSIYAQWVLFSLGHTEHLRLLIERAGIHNGLSLGIATENNHEVGRHNRLSIFVEIHHATFRKLR